MLHAFQGGSDGQWPVAGLLIGRGGKLFGTTREGGGGCHGDWSGTVFELTPSGSQYQETIVHAFTAQPDGAEPDTGLIDDSRGNLYGTTVEGGSLSNFGTIFEITP